MYLGIELKYVNPNESASYLCLGMWLPWVQFCGLGVYEKSKLVNRQYKFKGHLSALDYYVG